MKTGGNIVKSCVPQRHIYYRQRILKTQHSKRPHEDRAGPVLSGRRGGKAACANTGKRSARAMGQTRVTPREMPAHLSEWLR